MSNATPNYEQIIKDAGIKTTEAELVEQWQSINQSLGNPISNDSKWSAFWQLITALVTTPILQIIRFLIDTVFPNNYLQTASGMYLEQIGAGFAITRHPATKTQGHVTFSRIDTSAPVVIPAGTLIITPEIQNKIYSLQTIQEATFAGTDQTLEVLAEASEAGTSHNLASGYFNALTQNINNIASVETLNNWITTPGQDAETDEQYRERIRNQFNTLGDYHTDAVYKKIISDFNATPIKNIYFEHGAPRGPGSANVYLLTESGAQNQAEIDALNAHISLGFHGLGDDLLALAMPSVAVSVSADVYIKENQTANEQILIMQNVENIIRCAFRENQLYKNITKTAPFSRFSFSQLGKDIHENIAESLSIEFSESDIVQNLNILTLSSLTLTKHIGAGV